MRHMGDLSLNLQQNGSRFNQSTVDYSLQGIVDSFSRRPESSAHEQLVRAVARAADPALTAYALERMTRFQPRAYTALQQLRDLQAGKPPRFESSLWQRMLPLAPLPPLPAKASAEQQPEHFTVSVDTELARLAVAGGHERPLLVWLVARSLDAKGAGHVSRRQVLAGLRRAGVEVNTKTLQRWLAAFAAAGFGVLAGDAVYLKSQHKLAVALAAVALASNPVLVETNLPGCPSVSVPLGGSQLTVERFKGLMLGAWHAARAGARVAPISRKVLSALWGVSPHILRQWEAAAGVQASPHFAVFGAGAPPAAVAHHAYPAAFKREAPVAVGPVAQRFYHVLPMAQLSNSYTAPSGLIVGTAKRTPRQIRRAVRRQLDAQYPMVSAYSEQPLKSEGEAQLEPTGRRLFQASDCASTVKGVGRHLRRHQSDDPAAPHYAHMGATSRGTLYSVATDGSTAPPVLVEAAVLARRYRLPSRARAAEEAAVLASMGGCEAIRAGWGAA